jgi:hypothetical protein
MFGLENAAGPAGAVVVVGVVLLEAILLYVGYGALERLLGPRIIDILGGE